MSRVELKGVAKHFGGSVAVENIDLSIQQGELVALLGPSGCGKTTTLRMAAGFTTITRGNILFDDYDVTDLPPYRRNTGMVFQSYALFPHMNVFKNVAYGLQMRRVSAAQIRERVMNTLDRVRVAEYAARLPGQLSGGQQQRVALARALVIEPDVLLLDEPLSNLDAKLRLEVRKEIRQLQESLGLTTLFVTHDQEEALSIADRLVVMSQGRVEQIGTPSELYERPKSRFVAGFMGRSNFFNGRLERSAFVSDMGMRISVARVALDDRSTTLLGVRPERITIYSRGVTDVSNRLDGVIESTTYLGSAMEYAVRIPNGQLVLVERPVAQSAESPELTSGTEVTLGWSEEASMLLADDVPARPTGHS